MLLAVAFKKKKHMITQNHIESFLPLMQQNDNYNMFFFFFTLVISTSNQSTIKALQGTSHNDVR